MRVCIPPLRERAEDTRPLAHHFQRAWNQRLQRDVAGWSPEVEAYLLRHSWPGNVRELENALERVVVLARGDRLELDDLLVEPRSGTSGGSNDAGQALQSFLDRAAEERIRSASAETTGVRVEAARRLGIDRTTLYRLMRKHDIAG